MTKLCNHCDTVKPIEEFYKNTKGVYVTPCKDCKREHSRKWREANPGRVAELNRAYRERNPDYWRERRAIK